MSSRAPAIPLSTARPLRVSLSGTAALWMSGILWGAPVLMTVGGLGGTATAFVMVAGVISGAAMLAAPRLALVVLPFFTLLSPMGGFINLAGGKFLLSDLLFVAFAGQLAVMTLTGRMRINTRPSFAFLLVAVYVLATAVGLATGMLGSLKPLAYLVQLGIVWIYTTQFARDEGGWSLVLNSWLTAICFGAIVLVWAFLNATPLDNFEFATPDAVPVRVEQLRYVFRASYYYSGFHFLLGIASVIALVRLLFRKTVTHRLVDALVFAIATIALLMMLTKTAIAAVLVATVVLLVVMLPKWPRPTLKALGILGTALSSILVGLVVALFFVLGDTQADLWISRVFASGSLGARGETYVIALSHWIAQPSAVLGGLGPDFLDGSASPGMSTPFKLSPSTGFYEGTLDSGWLSFLLEFGILGFVVLAAIFGSAMLQVSKALRRLNPRRLGESPSVAIFASLIFLAVALTTQMIGYTKITWFPIQILAIALMHRQFFSGAAGR